MTFVVPAFVPLPDDDAPERVLCYWLQTALLTVPDCDSRFDWPGLRSHAALSRGGHRVDITVLLQCHCEVRAAGAVTLPASDSSSRPLHAAGSSCVVETAVEGHVNDQLSMSLFDACTAAVGGVARHVRDQLEMGRSVCPPSHAVARAAEGDGQTRRVLSLEAQVDELRQMLVHLLTHRPAVPEAVAAPADAVMAAQDIRIADLEAASDDHTQALRSLRGILFAR